MRGKGLWTALLFSVTAATATQDFMRLIVLDPGHSHAAALQATQLRGLSNEVHVYAPDGPDLHQYLDRVEAFNRRKNSPTHWTLKVYNKPDYLEQMQTNEPPGNVVILSGNNEHKIDYILTSLRAGQNVLADKPWVIEARDLSKLKEALEIATKKQLAAYDCMTQRFDVAYQIQRELVNDSSVFGDRDHGTSADPAIELSNLHALLKWSAPGKPSLRPAWFFDIRQQGEGIADVGTHLIDLLLWTMFPDQAIDSHRDTAVVSARRFPTLLTGEQFKLITGDKPWPSFLENAVSAGELKDYTNTDAIVSVRGILARVQVHWQYEAEPGAKDSYYASYRGTRAKIRLRAGPEEKFIPQVDVIPRAGQSRSVIETALRRSIERLSIRYPNLTTRDVGEVIRIVIPPDDRVPDDQYFARLVDKFMNYVRHPGSMPVWETQNMIAKYYLTTHAVELARQSSITHP